MKIDLENDLEKPGMGPLWESGNPAVWRRRYAIKSLLSLISCATWQPLTTRKNQFCCCMRQNNNMAVAFSKILEVVNNSKLNKLSQYRKYALAASTISALYFFSKSYKKSIKSR